MKATTKTLRDGETAVCDCCGSELTVRVVETKVGNFGTDCWKAIKGAAFYLKNAIRFPAAYDGTAEAAIARVEARYGAKAAWIKAVAA